MNTTQFIQSIVDAHLSNQTCQQHINTTLSALVGFLVALKAAGIEIDDSVIAEFKSKIVE